MIRISDPNTRIFTVDSELKEIQVSSWKNNRLPMTDNLAMKLVMSRLSSLLQELSNQFPCGLCFFLRQSFQNVSNFLSNVPYMRAFTEYEPATVRTFAKYRIQTYFISKLYSSAMYKIKNTVLGIFPNAQHRTVTRQTKKVRRFRINFRILKEEPGAARRTGFEHTLFMYLFCLISDRPIF
jgi:hypothetical protein